MRVVAPGALAGKLIKAAVAPLLPLLCSSALAEDPPARSSVNAIAGGVWGQTDFAVGMLEARAAFSKYLLVTAAPTAVFADRSDPEYQFRVGATFQLPLGPVQLDDRNLWVFSDLGTTRYRNRLRLTAPLDIGHRRIRLQLFDEVYYQQGDAGWFRNVVASGIGLDVSPTISADSYWMVLDDDNRRAVSMFVMLLTVRIR
jgi:hypothetical protein